MGTPAPNVNPAPPPRQSSSQATALGSGANGRAQSIAEIKGGPLVPGRIYRLQIGSFKTPRNAVEAFDRLSNAGLIPAWEPFGEYYRIVLTNIRAEEVPGIAEKLGTAGFKEAIARVEAYE
jgi:hypothetical protein